MPVRIRLQRHGKKNKPVYWVVAADARAKRDGKFLEKLGTYNPNVNPPHIELNVDGAVKWLHNGAQPTDTARNVLSSQGVLLKHHLEIGVNKGALTQEAAQAKFEAWVAEKEGKINATISGLDKAKAEARAKALEAEKAVNQKRKEEAQAVVAEVAAETEASEEVVAEAGSEDSVEETQA